MSGFGIGTFQVRGIHDFLRDLVLDAGQADVEATLNEMSAVGYSQVYFSVDGDVGRERDLHRVSHNLDRR